MNSAITKLYRLKVFSLILFILTYSLLYTTTLFAQSPNTWTQKASFPGVPRVSTVSFTIGSKVYIGTGQDSSSNLLSDFWEYDPAVNAWTQLADFTGSARRGAVGFVIGLKGYIGTGFDGTANLLDFYEYNPSINNWNQKKKLGNPTSLPRRDASAFTIGNQGYVVGGYDGTITWNKECWAYDGDTTWLKKGDLGNGGSAQSIARRWAVSFTIDTLGYVGCGYNYSQDWRKDFWRYNTITNAWTQMANFGGTPRSNALAFAINGKGYAGTGNDNDFNNDFWEFDPVNNTWMQVADYAGGAIIGGIGVSINGKGYAGLGRDSIAYRNDFWEYTPDSLIGVNGPADQNLSVNVFPNPCGEMLYIKSTKYEVQSIVIRNTIGEIVYIPQLLKCKGDYIVINTSSLSHGIYFLVLNSGERKVVKKFMKK